MWTPLLSRGMMLSYAVPELKGFDHNGIGVDVVLQNIVVVSDVGADK